MQEPTYPIFFPTYTPNPTGYARDWWWYDPEVLPEDSGPFASRSEAVVDWAWQHLGSCLLQDAQALELALDSPLLQPPATDRQDISAVLPVLRRALIEQQELAETGFEIVAQLDSMRHLNLLQGVSA